MMGASAKAKPIAMKRGRLSKKEQEVKRDASSGGEEDDGAKRRKMSSDSEDKKERKQDDQQDAEEDALLSAAPLLRRTQNLLGENFGSAMKTLCEDLNDHLEMDSDLEDARLPANSGGEDEKLAGADGEVSKKPFTPLEVQETERPTRPVFSSL